MSKVFCFGNGISRKHLNLDVFKNYGKTIGCNAIYRDFFPDILVANDFQICHEIYRSGYCENNQTYLADWNSLPIDALGMMTEQFEVDIVVDESDKEFVFHGNEKSAYATGLKFKSKVTSIDNELELYTGTLSIDIATKIENVTDIYLIGHDIYS
jgi:hypothetical protein